jgi:hypothetical protein
MGEPLADARLEDVKKKLRLIAHDAWVGLGREWLSRSAQMAYEEIVALEVGLACCVDGGTADMLVDALKLVLNSDMAAREEDEGRISETLDAVRAAILKATSSSEAVLIAPGNDRQGQEERSAGLQISRHR